MDTCLDNEVSLYSKKGYPLCLLPRCYQAWLSRRTFIWSVSVFHANKYKRAE